MVSRAIEDDFSSEAELFSHWEERWQLFVSDFTPTVTASTVSTQLRDKVKSGNAERAIGQGQQGREVFELLQNARDAIRDGGNDGEGRGYIGIHDSGILVANTGAPFDVFDPEVEEAVTMIGESSKGDADDEIGHKGVGLKSILASGEAFEIWTRHETATSDILRLRLSRAYITAALLSVLGCDTSGIHLRGSVESDEIASLLAATGDGTRDSLADKNRKELGKLPLFDFPVPVETTTGSDHPVAETAASLLAPDTDAWHGGQFRTAVFVEFEDDEWDRIREQFDIPHPDPPTREPRERAEQLWTHLSRRGSDAGLRPETLVQLGGVDTILAERVGEDVAERERWTVDRSPGTLEGDDFHHQSVTVEVTANDDPLQEHHFDQFSASESEVDAQLLVPSDASDRTEPRAYPLYLYYPIDNTRDVELPYCLHGHFKVNTNRRDLSRNSLKENRAVLEECIALVGRVSEAAADSDFGDRYPWILLPPPVSEPPTDPSTQASLLRWLRGALLAELRQCACIPTVGTDDERRAVSTDVALLHWEGAIREGFRALYTIGQTTDELTLDIEGLADVGFPTRATLDGWQSLPAAWESRVKALLAPDDPDAFAETVAHSWAGLLGTQLDTARVTDGTDHLQCDATAARALLRGTVETILQSGTEDDHLTELLESLESDLADVFLLPCRHIERDVDAAAISPTLSTPEQSTAELLLLAPIEPRRSPSGRRRTTQSTRSVFWDVDAPNRDLPPPEVPREESSFTVYLLDREIEQDERARRVLGLAGDSWGIRAYDGAPNYFRELLDTFASGDATRIKAIDFYFLATQIDKLGQRSDDLQTDEGSFLPLEYVKSAVAQPGDQRTNLTRRVALRTSRLQLPPDWETFCIRDHVLPDAWQRHRAEPDGDDSGTDEWATFDVEGWASWPAPESAAWSKMLELLDSETAHQRIARTLSLLGAASLPEIRCLWMYGLDHPDPGDNPPWNPTEWTSDDYRHTAGIPEQARTLQTALADRGQEYLTWITAPGQHPQATAEHSNKCPVNVDGVLDGVQLASWVWVADPASLRAVPDETLREIIHRYEDEYVESVLQTGWTCSNGHQREDYEWSDPIPTLLNWQLRDLDIWEPTTDLHPDLAAHWGADGDRLAYAVAQSGERGPRAWRLFPHVDLDAATLSEECLRTLGVRPIAEFSATEAAWHLQRLLAVLATAPLPDGADEAVSDRGWVRLEIPSGRSNDWNAAYTALLKPILQYLADTEADRDGFDLPYLRHLPIQQNGEWRIASLEWIQANAEQGRYYDERSPKPWERRAVEQNDDRWLLPQTSSGPFSHLPTALGIQPVDEPKPIADPDELTFVDASVGSLQSTLRERLPLLAAVVKRSGDQDVRTFIEELDTAIEDLRVAEAIPTTDTVADAGAPTSGLYAPRADTEAFVLAADAFDDDRPLEHLANAVALLAEQPTEISIFREALDPTPSVAELRDRWTRRTFPLEEIDQILGTRRRRRLRTRLDALVDLADAFDEPVETSVSDVLDDIDADQDGSAPLATVIDEEIGSDGSVAAMFVDELQTGLPSAVHPVMDRVLGTSTSDWHTVLGDAMLNADQEHRVIEWLEAHARTLDATGCFPQVVLSEHARILAVLDAWYKTAPDDLVDLETWETRLRDGLSTDRDVDWTDSLPDRLPHDAPYGELLFYCTASPGYESHVVEPLLTAIADDFDIGAEAAAVRAMLNQYIRENTLPTDDSSTSAAAYQADAFSDLQFYQDDFSTETVVDPEFDIQDAATRSTGQGSGGSRQYRGRGQQAEAAVLVAILNDMADWLADEPRGTIPQLQNRFRRLRQEEGDYEWHLDRVWSEELEPLLSRGGLTRESIVDWRSQIADGVQLQNLPLVRLCNVALEQGPGFDVIDPFGSLRGDRNRPDHFAPAEVKAVNGQTPPFHFRLTTNEYRRCKAFVQGGQSYIIRLVYVPDAETLDWISQTSFVAETIVENEADAEALVQDDPFDEVVKGGYMNLSAGGTESK